MINWLKNDDTNKVLNSISSIATILAVLGAIWIGIWQNKINDKILNLQSIEKEPMLSLGLSNIKIESNDLSFLLVFNNVGSVPITVSKYGIKESNEENNYKNYDTQIILPVSGDFRENINIDNLNKTETIIHIKTIYSGYKSKEKKCVESLFKIETYPNGAMGSNLLKPLKDC